MLSKGSSGDEVRELQKGLAVLGFDPGPADGIFGPKTDAAVRAFQKSAGLAVDGIVGPNTKQTFDLRVGAAQAAQQFSSGGASDDSADAGSGSTPL